MASTESHLSKLILTDRDQMLIKRLQKEEQSRFFDLAYNLTLGSFVLLIGTISFVGAGDHQALFIALRLIGAFVIIRGIYECFFNHRRRLILKLIAENSPNH